MNTERTVARATSYLRGLASRRKSRTVTADDVQNFLSRNGFPSKTNARLSVIRSVLRTPNFRPTGSAPSSRPAARGRKVTTWTV